MKYYLVREEKISRWSNTRNENMCKKLKSKNIFIFLYSGKFLLLDIFVIINQIQTILYFQTSYSRQMGKPIHTKALQNKLLSQNCFNKELSLDEQDLHLENYIKKWIQKKLIHSCSLLLQLIYQNKDLKPGSLFFLFFGY